MLWGTRRVYFCYLVPYAAVSLCCVPAIRNWFWAFDISFLLQRKTHVRLRFSLR